MVIPLVILDLYGLEIRIINSLPLSMVIEIVNLNEIP